MGQKLNLRNKGTIAILAISVAGAGLIIGHVFLLESELFLTFFTVIVLCAILGWIRINRENRTKDDPAKRGVLEILGKPGIVIQECSPEGKVRIGDVTWSAISYDGITLRVGERITVQDLQELKLTVKAEPSSMSAHR
jgi:membrane-bound serine protease (ClpP class)